MAIGIPGRLYSTVLVYKAIYEVVIRCLSSTGELN